MQSATSNATHRPYSGFTGQQLRDAGFRIQEISVYSHLGVIMRLESPTAKLQLNGLGKIDTAYLLGLLGLIDNEVK